MSEASDIVQDVEELDKLIKTFEIENRATFRVLKEDKDFGKEIHLSKNVFTVRYEDPQKGTTPAILSDGIPFTICGRKILECHQGKDRKKKSKERALLLKNTELPEILDDLQKNTLFKGCRHLTNYEEEQWILREDVFRGLKFLEDRGLTLDLAIRSHQLKYIPTLLKRLPKLKIVLDHIACPDMKEGAPISPWKEDISAIAAFPNVYCKLSGFVTSGDRIQWKKEDFQRFIDHAISCFGIDRCMFGSDWPVCTLAARSGYADVYKLLNDLLPSLSDEDKDKLFRENAKKFYSLQL